MRIEDKQQPAMPARKLVEDVSQAKMNVELMPDDEIWAKLTGDEDRQHSSKGLVKEPSRAPKSPADIHV